MSSVLLSSLPALPEFVRELPTPAIIALAVVGVPFLAILLNVIRQLVSVYPARLPWSHYLFYCLHLYPYLGPALRFAAQS
jgi:hypothetical protein